MCCFVWFYFIFLLYFIKHDVYQLSMNNSYHSNVSHRPQDLLDFWNTIPASWTWSFDVVGGHRLMAVNRPSPNYIQQIKFPKLSHSVHFWVRSILLCVWNFQNHSVHTHNLQSEIWKFVSGNACLRYVERSVGRDDAQLVVETVADVEGRQGEDVGALSAVVRTQDEQRITRVRRRVPVCTIVKNPRKVKIK